MRLITLFLITLTLATQSAHAHDDSIEELTRNRQHRTVATKRKAMAGVNLVLGAASTGLKIAALVTQADEHIEGKTGNLITKIVGGGILAVVEGGNFYEVILELCRPTRDTDLIRRHVGRRTFEFAAACCESSLLLFYGKGNKPLTYVTFGVTLASELFRVAYLIDYARDHSKESRPVQPKRRSMDEFSPSASLLSEEEQELSLAERNKQCQAEEKTEIEAKYFKRKFGLGITKLIVSPMAATAKLAALCQMAVEQHPEGVSNTIDPLFIGGSVLLDLIDIGFTGPTMKRKPSSCHSAVSRGTSLITSISSVISIGFLIYKGLSSPEFLWATVAGIAAERGITAAFQFIDAWKHGRIQKIYA